MGLASAPANQATSMEKSPKHLDSRISRQQVENPHAQPSPSHQGQHRMSISCNQLACSGRQHYGTRSGSSAEHHDTTAVYLYGRNRAQVSPHITRRCPPGHYPASHAVSRRPDDDAWPKCGSGVAHSSQMSLGSRLMMRGAMAQSKELSLPTKHLEGNK